VGQQVPAALAVNYGVRPHGPVFRGVAAGLQVLDAAFLPALQGQAQDLPDAGGIGPQVRRLDSGQYVFRGDGGEGGLQAVEEAE
jgi:hypothetical protein